MKYARDPEPEAADSAEFAAARRMFLFEAGWCLGVKNGSQREFCHMMAPGEDHYHRLHDREIFLVRDGEKICFACATRRGLIIFEPKLLREVGMRVPADLEAIPLEIDVRALESAGHRPTT
jgi:hypothetical protein